jgi:hypothetical protein
MCVATWVAGMYEETGMTLPFLQDNLQPVDTCIQTTGAAYPLIRRPSHPLQRRGGNRNRMAAGAVDPKRG